MENCAGQNKNKMEINYFEFANNVFYVVSHTKNPAHQLIDIAKKFIKKQNIYTMQQFISLINESRYNCAIEALEMDVYNYNLLLDQEH